MPAAALSWQCRRGTRELDVLLRDYLDGRYENADGDEKSAFRALLTLPDPELIGYLLYEQVAADPELARVINQVRSRTHTT